MICVGANVFIRWHHILKLTKRMANRLHLGCFVSFPITRLLRHLRPFLSAIGSVLSLFRLISSVSTTYSNGHDPDKGAAGQV
jgi:hypothetical protein